MSIFKDLWEVVKGGFSKKGVEGFGQMSKAMIKQPIESISQTATHINDIKRDSNIFSSINDGKRILKDSLDTTLGQQSLQEDAKLESKFLNTNNKTANTIIDKLIIKPTTEIGNVSKHISDIVIDTEASVAKPVAIAGEVAVGGAQFVAKDGLKAINAAENIIDYLINHPYALLLGGVASIIIIKKI